MPDCRRTLILAFNWVFLLLDQLQLLAKFVFYFNLHLIALSALSNVLYFALFSLLEDLLGEKTIGLCSVLGCHAFFIFCLKEIRKVSTLDFLC